VSAPLIATIVFLCLFGGALLGLLLQRVLPEHHLGQDSKDVVRLGMGLIATMAALVLGLVTASAKQSFDGEGEAVRHSVADVLMLDRVLAQYGPDTREVRDLLRRAVATRLELLWPGATARSEASAPESTPRVELLEARIRALSPQNDLQRGLQARALELSDDLQQTRWLVIEGEAGDIPLPFLVVVVFWLTVIFASFGLFAPRNGTVVSVLLVCAFSLAGSIFLILEMDHPLSGLLKVSNAPLRLALAQLGP
jgi:hypothetical protein